MKKKGILLFVIYGFFLIMLGLWGVYGQNNSLDSEKNLNTSLDNTLNFDEDGIEINSNDTEIQPKKIDDEEQNFTIKSNLREEEVFLSSSQKVEQEVYDKIEEKGFADVIVKLNDGNLDFSTIEILREKVDENQISVLSHLSEDDFSIKFKHEVLNSFSGKLTASGLQILIEHPLVEFVYSVKILHINLQESVPLINADDVWEIEDDNGDFITGQGQVVCVLDSGIDYTHPDLGGCIGKGCKVIGGYDFYNDDGDPIDDNDHGTHVTGIVASNGKLKGVAPDASLLAVKVCDSNANCPSDSMSAGADWCINNMKTFETSILTMSIGDSGEYNSNNCPNWMDPAINTAYSFNLPFTIASGNDGHKNGISYPACSANAISVGATYDEDVGPVTWNSAGCVDDTTEEDKVACGSNSDEILDVMAPGAMIISTVRGGGYEEMFGTSMATPHVAGTIALMKQHTPNLTVNQILSNIKNTGVPVTDEGNGLSFPRIDALVATSCTIPREGQNITQDTILCPGDYVLPNGLVVDSPNIILECNGANLSGINQQGIGIYIEGHDNITIKNCNVENYKHGIIFNYSSFNTFENNYIASNKLFGIILASSHNNKIANNLISLNEQGISLKDSSQNTLANNSISSNFRPSYGIAITLSRSDDTSFIGNTLESNDNGIDIYDSEGSILIDNIISSNERNGLRLVNSNKSIIANNTIKNTSSGIIFEESENNQLINNILSSNRVSGIKLSYSPNNTLSQNSISGSYYNLNIIENFDQTIDFTNTVNGKPVYYIYNAQNTIFDEQTEIGFFACIKCDNIIVKNLVLSDNSHGILLYSTNNSILQDNTLSGNNNGIHLIYSNNNIISKNSASSNENGILLESSHENEIVKNVADSNDENSIHFSFSNNNTLRDNMVNLNEIGFFIFNASQNTIINNTVTSNGDGFYLYNASQNTIVNNSVNSNGNGFLLYYSSQNLIRNNTINLNEGGIFFSRSNSNSIINNDISFNSDRAIEFAGIYDINSGNNISGNTLNSNHWGIIISSSENNAINNNIINSNYGGIIETSNVKSNIFVNNTINSNDVGIRVVGETYSGYNQYTNNIINSNDVGIKLENSLGGDIFLNNIISSNNYGVNASSHSMHLLESNTISSNNYGVYISSGYNKGLRFNNITSNNYGVYISSGDRNALAFNTITSNNISGILLSGSTSNNYIIDNYFNNANNAFDEGLNNWNVTLDCTLTNIIGGPCIGGNFWNDYNGEDINGDGIGDTNLPYNSSGNIINGGDYLPLVSICLGDIDDNDVVDFEDILIILSNWGTEGPGDINNDGIVDFGDLLIVLANWGPCGEGLAENEVPDEVYNLIKKYLGDEKYKKAVEFIDDKSEENFEKNLKYENFNNFLEEKIMIE